MKTIFKALLMLSAISLQSFAEDDGQTYPLHVLPSEKLPSDSKFISENDLATLTATRTLLLGYPTNAQLSNAYYGKAFIDANFYTRALADLTFAKKSDIPALKKLTPGLGLVGASFDGSADVNVAVNTAWLDERIQSMVSGGVPAPKAAQLFLQLDEWTDWEIKVMNKWGVCLYFFSTHFTSRSSFADSHPGIVDMGAEVLFTASGAYGQGDGEGRNYQVYPYKTLTAAHACLGWYITSNYGAATKLGGVIFKPDWSKKWVRDACQDQENSIIIWRSNPIAAEYDTWGRKVWRPLQLNLTY